MGKELLVESYTVKSSEYKKIPLQESTFLIEGKEYSCVAAYTFPISRPGQKNLNGRIYESNLWEGVIKRQEGENAFGLCDHPDGSGSVKDGFCVWHNVRFNEDRSLVVADAYLFGQWGRQAKEAMEAGGELGMSSVGYGEFKKDNVTIDENTYELVRPADWVLDPSYQVFGNKEGAISTEESTEANLPSEDEETQPEEDTIQENQEEKSTMTKLEEKIFRVQMEGVLKDIKAITSLAERKKEAQKNLAFFDNEEICPEIQEEFSKILEDVEKEIGELAEKGTKLEETATKKEEAEGKVEELTSSLEEATKEKEVLTLAVESAEALSDSLKALVQEAQAKIEDLENTVKTQFHAEEVSDLKKKYEEEIASLKETVAKREKVISQYRSKVAEKKPKEGKVSEEVSEEETFAEGITPAVKSYYNKLREAHPAVIKIKEEILGCKTLIEAQKKFIDLKAVVFETSYRESYLTKTSEKKEETEVPKRRTLPKLPKKSLPLREGWN